MQAVLILEDGKKFVGESVGAAQSVSGEVVFNTGMTGYQEVLTDPSYYGQIVVMTYPLIGNYGINHFDVESYRPHVRGFVAREFCAMPNNYRVEQSIDEYLKKNNIAGIVGIDTRALTRHLRNAGTMKGIIRCAGVDFIPADEDPDYIRKVAVPQTRHYPGPGRRVVVVDCGVKQNIIRSLKERHCDITIVPPWTSAQDILNLAPDGVLISNGPGDPMAAPYLVETARALLGRTVLFGICYGHQILGLAMGGQTYKLKFGHRGANHPIKDLVSGKVYITTQNHGYAVDAASLPEEVDITQINLNDNTVEGLAHRYLPAFSVQYHPEASPGPQDSKYLFDQFVAMMGQKETLLCRKKAI